jgi:multicomponent Na+:H+ antiporter subunit E
VHERETFHDSPPDGGARPAPEIPRARYRRRTLALFVVLSLFWLLLSGRVGIQYFVFMIASVSLVIWMNPERPFRGLDPEMGGGAGTLLRALANLGRYVLWLVWNMIKANLEVARIILHPKLPIDPQFVVFRTTLQRDMAKVVVANSITLTPGTVTVDLAGNEYLVHAIVPGSANAILSGELQNVVGRVFNEKNDPPPDVTWLHSYEELGR